ncbi:MAG: AAA family ATPase, partial [Caulobacterales bacterium]|nr:AAA family ATPase [Caulobacterales bacterium]
DLKSKIDSHRDFYNIGIEIIDQEHRTSCPLCEQSIIAAGPKAVIDAYVKYFSDEEATHKSELRRFNEELSRKEEGLTNTEIKLTRSKLRFDGLKAYLPSTKDSSLAGFEGAIKAATGLIGSLRNAIEEKAKNLSNSVTVPGGDLWAMIREINLIIGETNASIEALSRSIAESDKERKKLQREVCAAVEREFVISRWSEIVALMSLQKDAKDRAADLAALEASSPSSDARVRVADSFELLLREFFGERYIFDKQNFVLKRGDHEMARGPHRTLSDGEKTAIAFCYFVACVHRKVTSNSEYHRLFLVFDDPVTSMSYDFVFAIAQTLKNLNISDQGEVSINPGRIDGNKFRRPELLILTHSSYFFNISITNRVIAEGASYALYEDKGVHKLAGLNRYVAPFQEQLKEVYEIANGGDPKHSTANAIRSVLEAVGRFCRPDKSDSLTLFVQHLAAEDGIIVKSILINSFCHGSYYEETPPPDDLKMACEETITVVERYAAGQLEIIKGM